MNEKQLNRILTQLAEEMAPSDEIDLWPAIQNRLVMDTGHAKRRNNFLEHRFAISKSFRLAAIITVALLFGIVLLLGTPQGQVLAQEFLQFFSRAKSDAYPLQPWQKNPLPTSVPGTPTLDPANISNATLSIQQMQEKAGFAVLVPTWLPDNLSLVGATFDRERSIARIFYRYQGTNGLVLKEESFSRKEDCALCGEVGASAQVETVDLGNVLGEYVEGVWKLTDRGPVWVSDPYLKTLRWQENGMAFELEYMGPPDTLTKDQMIAIVKSLK
jgi:hypothetical protein